jgi:hypothetical protein
MRSGLRGALLCAGVCIIPSRSAVKKVYFFSFSSHSTTRKSLTLVALVRFQPQSTSFSAQETSVLRHTGCVMTPFALIKKNPHTPQLANRRGAPVPISLLHFLLIQKPFSRIPAEHSHLIVYIITTQTE